MTQDSSGAYPQPPDALFLRLRQSRNDINAYSDARIASGERVSFAAPQDDRTPSRTSSVQLPVVVEGREIALEALAFRSRGTGAEALCLIHKGVGREVHDAPIVRVHSGCITGDIFHSLKCDCHQQLQGALAIIAAAPHGVLIYLPGHEGRGIGLFNKIRAYALQEEGLDTVDANIALGAPVDGRDYSFAAEILMSLGIGRLRLLSNNPDKARELEEKQLTIVECLPLVVPSNSHNDRYLRTKRDRLSHKL